MGNIDLAIRFTDTKYATRAEVSKELQTSLIDNIWLGISNYRKQFNEFIDLNNIDSKQFFICLCNGVIEKSQAITDKFHDLNNRVLSFQDDEKSYREFIETSLFEIMNYVGSLNGEARSIPSYRDLYRNIIKPNNDIDDFVLKYIDTLDKLQSDWKDIRGDELLCLIYQNLTGKEGTYRSTNDSNVANRVLVDRIYTCAPVNLIQPLLNSLYAFIEESNLSTITKTAIIYFYICLIKPFNDHNEEVAMLVAKNYIATRNSWSDSIYIPLEKIFVDDINKSSKLFIESQKYSDVTYFVNHIFNIYLESLTFTFDTLSVVIGHQMTDEFYGEDKTNDLPEKQETKEVVDESINEEGYQFSIEESINENLLTSPEEKIQEKEQEENKNKESHDKDISETKVIKPNFERKVVNVIQPTNEGLAIGSLPPVIDEKEAQRLTIHLLELDPSLRKAEAKFYARHCTLGKSYTIQQFKKYNGCVYETARTGMEHLVELGYYRKDQIKNKFVYSPIMRRN